MTCFVNMQIFLRERHCFSGDLHNCYLKHPISNRKLKQSQEHKNHKSNVKANNCLLKFSILHIPRVITYSRALYVNAYEVKPGEMLVALEIDQNRGCLCMHATVRLDVNQFSIEHCFGFFSIFSCPSYLVLLKPERVCVAKNKIKIPLLFILDS